MTVHVADCCGRSKAYIVTYLQTVAVHKLCIG